MNEENMNGTLFLALKKAFNIVDHNSLSWKLEIKTFDKLAVMLSKSYFKN